MPVPDRRQQIVQTHADFICRFVEFAQRPDARSELDRLLGSAEESGWSALVGVLRKVAAGRRDIAPPEALDDEDRVILDTILAGLQDPATLPDPTARPDPALAAPGLAGMIHAAGRGDVAALTLVSQMAEQMSRVGGDMSKVAAVIRPMINGERDPDRLCDGMDTRGRQLVLNILTELGGLDRH